MLGRLYEAEDCSAARALELVGERWSLLILRDAMFRGFTRFSEFEHGLGVAPNVLAKRLSGFVDAGIMDARPDGEYRLTAKGLDLKPVVVALTAWGDKWVGPGPVEYVHHGCGGRIRQQLGCSVCDSAPALSEVVVKPRGAGGDRTRRLGSAALRRRKA